MTGGEQQPPYGPPPYGPPPYGPPPYGPPSYGPPAYGPPSYAPYGYLPAPSSPSASAIVLVVTAGLATTSCWFTLAGVPALILGIKALTAHTTDPTGAAGLARLGWTVLGGIATFEVVAAVVLFAAAR